MSADPVPTLKDLMKTAVYQKSKFKDLMNKVKVAEDRYRKQLEDLQSGCRTGLKFKLCFNHFRCKVKASINAGEIVQGGRKTCKADLNPAPAKL